MSRVENSVQIRFWPTDKPGKISEDNLVALFQILKEVHRLKKLAHQLQHIKKMLIDGFRIKIPNSFIIINLKKAV